MHWANEIVNYYTEGCSCFKNALCLLFPLKYAEDILGQFCLDNHWPLREKIEIKTKIGLLNVFSGWQNGRRNASSNAHMLLLCVKLASNSRACITEAVTNARMILEWTTPRLTLFMAALDLLYQGHINNFEDPFIRNKTPMEITLVPADYSDVIFPSQVVPKDYACLYVVIVSSLHKLFVATR